MKQADNQNYEPLIAFAKSYNIKFKKMRLDIDREMNFSKENEIIESVLALIYGGYDGLEILFIKKMNKFNKNKNTLNHNNFEDFCNGTDIEILHIYDKEFIKNEFNFFTFSTFFEENFLFDYIPTAYDSFNDVRNILHDVLSKINKFCFENDFSENQKSIIINKIVLQISIEINKSDRCAKDENKILFDKLIYISNGYKSIYNKIYEMFGQYINTKQNNFLNSNFTDDEINSLNNQKEIKVSNWELIFIEIITKNIDVVEINNNVYDYFYVGKNYDNASDLGNHVASVLKKKKDTIRPIVTNSINGYGIKNIFIEDRKKIKKMEKYIEKYGNSMSLHFQEKYNTILVQK